MICGEGTVAARLVIVRNREAIGFLSQIYNWGRIWTRFTSASTTVVVAALSVMAEVASQVEHSSLTYIDFNLNWLCLTLLVDRGGILDQAVNISELTNNTRSLRDAIHDTSYAGCISTQILSQARFLS